MTLLHMDIQCKFFEIGKIELALKLGKIVILELISFLNLY